MPDTVLGAEQRSSKKKLSALTVMEESIRLDGQGRPPWGGDNVSWNLNHEKDPAMQWPGERAIL